MWKCLRRTLSNSHQTQELAKKMVCILLKPMQFKFYNVLHRDMCTHVAVQQFYKRPNKRKMTSPAPHSHQTPLHPLPLLPLTLNKNHMHLIENTISRYMCNSPPQFMFQRPAAQMSIWTQLLSFQHRRLNRSQVTSHYKARQGSNGVVKAQTDAGTCRYSKK